ncbi:Oxidoreductase HTATIP2 [Armadillidium nasatum]|uniref:Protein HTATIP2 n=1 Tax=Armadillidium nasatum TaxID=96803 RepID=A0A5N5STW3_9CRUS|nr:Oxidoreductase HTATIP2 [Armadillidium nasatum]
MGSEAKVALVLGASGAIGKEIIKELIKSPRIGSVKVVTRRPLGLESNKIEEKVVDFDKLDQHEDAFQDVQIAYCSLGTTRANAGAEGFVKVDRDYVYEAAKLLKVNNCPHFNLVTSGGADINSSFLYMKTKGEVEKMVTDLDFERLSIFRPGLLLCEREQSRPFEKILQLVAKGFDWRSKLSISVETVAHAMVVNSFLEKTAKVEIIENKDINCLGID